MECSVGLGPDNFLSVRTSGRRKHLGQNGLSGRPFFLSGQVGAGCRCNPMTRLQLFPIEMGYF